jgi:uncharacterized protein (DUF486 family)
MLRTVLLLIASNAFMNAAWYGHLKFKAAPLVVVVLASWLIALPEYALQVPANRIGSGFFTTTQLKILQEAISLGVFVVFAFLYFGETPTWRSGLALLLVIGAVALANGDAKRPPEPEPGAAPDGTAGQP